MTRTIIYERNGWRLTVLGHGWAYQLIDHDSGRSLWVQDESAQEFERNVMCDGWLVNNCEERFSDYADIMTEEVL